LNHAPFWTTILLKASVIAGMTGACHCAQLLIEMSVMSFFAQADLEPRSQAWTTMVGFSVYKYHALYKHPGDCS
jgi:hypothetical protein